VRWFWCRWLLDEEAGSLTEQNTMGVEEALETLGSVSSGFSKESREHQAIELAAKALHYVFHDEVKRRFEAFLKDFDSELTGEQKDKLQRMGVEPRISDDEADP
jgi:hypothetical protein